MRLIIYVACALASICLFSCGPSKELLSAQARADSLNMVNSRLKSDMKQQTDQFNGQINHLNLALSASNAQNDQLKNQNAVAMQESYDCRKAKEAVAKRMEEFNQALAANGLTMKEIRRKAAEALAEFTSAGVEVSYRNGLVYISMQDELLFNPGSAKLGKNGQEALAVVARVLNENPNLLIYVIGNTDSVKVYKGFTDNWSLSTERANSVVRILRDKYLVSMNRVTAAGRGRYAPIADNATPEGRAKNRRTDIILNPDLNRLWELTDKQP